MGGAVLKTSIFALVLIFCVVHGQNVIVEFVDTQLEVKEGDHFNVRISKRGIIDEPVLVVVTVPNDPGNDFVGSSQVARYDARASGVTAVTFTVTDDTVAESDELFYLRLEPLDQNVRVGSKSRLQIIIKANDDAYGVFSIDEPSPVIVTEKSFTTVTKLKVRREVSAFEKIVVKYMVNSSESDARPGQDVLPVIGEVTFQAQQTEAEIPLQIRHDDIPERDESFFVTLTSATYGATVLGPPTEVIIKANDAAVRFSSSQYRFEEGPKTKTVTVDVTRGLDSEGQPSLFGDVNHLVTLRYIFEVIEAGLALDPEDFRGTGGVLTFQPMETRKTISFLIEDDDTPEIEEFFLIRLFNLQGEAELITPSVAKVIINANDNPSGVISFRATEDGEEPQQRINEDTFSSVTFPVQRYEGTFGEVSVRWELARDLGSSGPINEDVGPTEGIVTFGDGENEASITLTVVQDNSPEPAEMFRVTLLPQSVTGNVVVEGVTVAHLLVEDSDDVYGTVEFGPGTDHMLITTSTPRTLRLSVTRSGGRQRNLVANISVEYDDSYHQREEGDVLAESRKTVVLPAGQDPVLVNFDLQVSAFLSVGGEFTAVIESLGFEEPPRYGSFNGPKIGLFRPQTVVLVDQTQANGETGFFNVTNLIVEEPEDGVTQVGLLVSREGLSGRAVVRWSVSGTDITTDDLEEMSGSVILETGMSEAVIDIGIKADDIPELTETVVVSLTSIEPSDAQRLRPGATSIVIDVLSNDNPGGIIQLSPQMASSFEVEEGKGAVQVILERTGGVLEERSVRYSISPAGEEQFYGATNVITFQPGMREVTTRIVAIPDGKPEVSARFTLSLIPMGDPLSVLGERTSVSITILGSDNPFGVIQFYSDPTIVTTGEGQAGEQLNVSLMVQRDWGTNGQVTVPWSLSPADQLDLTPGSGTLVFEDGQSQGEIVIQVVNDDIPEGDEQFVLQLSTPGGGATAGFPMVARIDITENDNPVVFTEPVLYASEPQNVILTIEREGRVDKEAHVYYRTLDGSAAYLDGDYVQIPTQQLVFAPGERQKTVQVSVLDDDVPEGNETFSVQLLDVGGDLIVTDASTATILILANDDAFGVFSFGEPRLQEVEEGSTVFYSIQRSRGNVGSVRVYWELRVPGSAAPLTPGDDFPANSGFTDFSSQENQKPLAITPLADRVPETAESFQLVLTRVEVTSGGTSDDNLVSLSSTNLVATVNVQASDDPNGRMAFNAESRELTVAEDFLPGNEETTQATFTVERRQGTRNDVKVLWEIFSDKVGGDLPPVVDLLFIGQWPSVVNDVSSNKRRPGTMTPVALLSGAQGHFITVNQEEIPALTNQNDGFSVSAWVQPFPDCDGYIIGYATSDAATHYLSLRLAASGAASSLTLRLSSSTQLNQELTVDSAVKLDDGQWHQVVVALGNTTVRFYLDGKLIETATTPDTAIQGGPGDWLVGAAPPGSGLYTGYLQDVRIFMRALEASAVSELYLSSPFEDITPISGILNYDAGVRTQTFSVQSKQDIEEEGREVFTVILLGVAGGAALSVADSRTTLSVLKSDNANGLFGFESQCSPPRAVDEAVVVTCSVVRERGDDGTVTVSWLVEQRLGQDLVEASADFEETRGSVVFLPGIRSQTFQVQLTDENTPELDELFQISLTSAVSDDGLVGSTETSGASLDPARQTSQLVIAENDYPYGLLQFANIVGQLPQPGVMIPPVSEAVKVTVSEEGGVVPLVVVRAQGTLGEIRAEWRTKDITALSEGKSPPDYVGAVGNILMASDINYAYVNITVKDNSLPETEKTFSVELVNPTGGAELGAGAQAIVTIEASDGAFGVFQFAESSLNVAGNEGGDDGFNVIPLQVSRLAGLIGVASVSYEVDETAGDQSSTDIVNPSGVLTFQAGQDSETLNLQVRGDTVPELDEIVMVRLVQTVGGQLGDPLRTTATVTVLANDDPYGKFIVAPSFRPGRTEEKDQDVRITVQRVGGTSGTVEVDYVTLDPTETYPFLPGPVTRADTNDYEPTEGKVSFGSGQETAELIVHTLDDSLPEQDESVFVRLTRVRFIQDGRFSPVPDSPRLGIDSETYAQLIISSNDDASGRLTLSPNVLTVSEGEPSVQLYVQRAGGNFGEVTVAFKAVEGTARMNLDFVLLSRVVILASGESRKRVPLELIDDRVPELAEEFTVELVEPVTGGAVLGEEISTVLTIEPSDDPNGVFSFVSEGQTVKELEADYSVDITVSRTGGSMGVVTVNWEATLDGKPASADVSPSSGSLYFVSNDASHKISISILPDTIPEGSEAIMIRLTSATNGGRIDTDTGTYTLTIAPNDSPHGMVQLASDTFSVAESGADGTQTATVVRSGGDYGRLMVFYSTSVLSLVDLVQQNNGNILDLFESPYEGVPEQLEGTAVDLTNLNNARQYCARACLLQSSCASFLYKTDDAAPVCLWYTSTIAPNLLQYDRLASYYSKDMDKISQLTVAQARDGEDFSSLSNTWMYVEDGQTSAELPLSILDDALPELQERFLLRLDEVRVDESSASENLEAPKLGPTTEAVVVIETNDNAFGVFSIVKPVGAGSGTLDSHVLEVLESDRLAVDLVVERQEGTLGEVSVEWSISIENRTATYGQDYIADGATVIFSVGQTRRVITLTILDDNIPEDDEELTVVLSNPKGGATLSDEDSMKVVILANDFVAGRLSFQQTSQLVNEGDNLTVAVLRSAPGAGNVTADWLITGRSGTQAALGFAVTSGNLNFLPGELKKEINLEVLEDDTPEVNEEYSLTLQNIVTEGVGSTGQSELDPQRGALLITIAASNEPHGVFQLGLTDEPLTFEEDVGTAAVAVERKFGAIGIVRVSYEVLEGSLQPFGARERARAGQDFVAATSGYIDMGDGVTSGTIDVIIVDDAEPEIDEVFLLRLTSVALIDSTDQSQPPKLESSARETEVTINANDGAKGIIEFAQDSQSVSVTEQGQDISLTVVRGGGTFGRVTVYYHSGPVTESTVAGQDYNLEDAQLVFEEGESRKSIVISILDDTEPEPAETFTVTLAQPSNGAALGKDTKASVTILANDNAGGIISFDTADFIQMREATPGDPSKSKAEILVKRGPGAFGSLSVPYTVTTSSGQFTADVTPETGTIEFADRQTTAVLVLETVNDDTPEVEETFTLTLQEPPGDAILGDITSRTLVIEASDAPFGLMEIYTADSRLSSYSVEEALRTLVFDIVRSQGTLGKVTVDVMTVPGTATATTDMARVVLAPITSAPGASVVDWHHIASHVSATTSDTSEATSFLVMLTSLPSNTQLASMVPADSGLGAGQSVLFKWQGQLTHMRTFQTDGASAATSFTSGGSTYLVVANSGREGSRQVSSFLYRLSAQGELEVIQGLPTSGASDVTSFLHGTRRFLFVANSLDDNSRSDITSHMYSWDEDQGRFSSAPVQLVPTLYASGVVSFTVDGKTFVAVANYFDRSSGSYQVSSVVYRMESDLTLVQHQQLATRGAVSLVYTEAGNMQLLAVANNRQDVIATPQDSAVYRWDGLAQAFVLHQTLPTIRAVKVTAVRTSGGSALLMFASATGNSEIFVWDVERSQYKTAWKGGPFQALRPLIFRQPNSALDAVAAAHIGRLEAPEIFQLAHVAAGSDFVPRRVTMTFEPSQAVLRTSVVTLTDDTPEDTESFSVSLVSPLEGAELGPQASVSVEILSNDDAHGIIEFNEDSLELIVEESVDKETTVQLNVVRRLGFFGRVTVAWQATGDHGGVGDITPLNGQVTLPNGQSVATITLSIRDDKEPEFDEVTYIRLTEIVDDGTTLDTKGARLGTSTVATVTVLANDSPYGVVSWERTAITVAEPEGTDTSVAVTITRRQGLERAIRVNYVTSVAASLPESSQATPGQDFVSTQGNVVLAEGISTVKVLIVIKQDSEPEADETFLVNLTSVNFQGQDAASGAAPSIALNGGVVEITITENDNARGFVELDVKTNNEGRLDVYEEFGQDVTIKLPIRRRVGFFGSLIVTWQADPVEADVLDFSPASGTVEFADQQATAEIVISILDDAVPEDMETFDVKLIDVTGDAGLGLTTSVRIAILKNDSPTGLFRFATSQVETQEAKTPSDPAGRATLIVQRLQGSQGLVNVRWRLNAEAESDFETLEATVQFSQGELEKAIVLQTSPDTILEGREEFIVSLVSADNNADISNTDGDSTVVILPDGGASGTISILPETRSVLVGEPGESKPGYPGEVEIKLTRGQGIFGEVVVTWSLTPRNLSAFLQVEGSLKFLDLQQTVSIVLQTRDDSVPELRQTFTLQLNSASGGAVLSPVPEASKATVTYAASDYPHGLVQFQLPELTVVKEDQGNVVVTVSRGKGLNGQLQVAYSTKPGEASENQDYLPSAGLLTFPAGVDSQTITVTILPDDISEGPEDFFLTLTSVALVDDANDYTEVGGLTQDMAPALGPLSTKTIQIDKNDNAEGILQFSQDTYAVREEGGVATVKVTRLRGSHGRVTVQYVTEMLTATEGVDYVGAAGELALADGVSEAEINITLKDDTNMEQLESFRVTISNVTGGAQLGSPSVATVNILKSDFPNGRFAFPGPLQISLPNPETQQRTVLMIERTGGVLGQQEVFWRIMGPNNPNLQLEDTTDLSYLSDQGSEVTTGSFTWADGESGSRQLRLDVKAYTSWEVEKTFVVELYKVVATPQGIGEGEVDQETGQVSIKIERFGDPNGVVEFVGAATREREVLEPDGTSPAALVFELTRRTGTGVVGTVEIFWEVRPVSVEESDVQQSAGSIIMAEGQRDAQIVLQILPDDIPELTEQFSLVLVRVEGGATLNQNLRESRFSIRYNDQPHGEFGLDEDLQAVEVNAADMSRHVKVVVSRLGGTFGRVLASYTISYDLTGQGIALEPSTGTVTFEAGETETVSLASIRGDGFLKLGSTFTVRLTEVRFLGSGVTSQPEIRDGMSQIQVAVPALAANTELSFSSDIAFVNEDDETLTVTLVRAGTFGNLAADWISGYSAANKPAGLENGEITPALGSVDMFHGQEEATLTVQLTAQVNRTEAFVLRLPRPPQTVVSGGARLATTNQMVRAEPAGLIQFSDNSITALASELNGKLTLTLWRLYGSESRLAVYYETTPQTALRGLDFQDVSSGVVSMDALQTVAQFDLQIYQDNLPEQAEGFYVNLTNVEKLPTPIEPVLSPRLSETKSLSTVTIEESNDPYGVLSITPTQVEVVEGFKDVTLTVVRSAGDFGTVSVKVRTVGGGESWTSGIVPDTSETGRPADTISEALGRRESQRTATGGLDYDILDTAVEMQARETEKRIKVTIIEDNTAEPEESVLVYLTEPLGGARVASGMRDGGKKGFAEVLIGASDLSNGIIGFDENSRNVQVDEDASPPVAALKLTRLNTFIGTVTVGWKAKKTLTSTDQEDAQLNSQLNETAGTVECPAGQSLCDLFVYLKDDDTPEESFSFIVVLTSTEPDAQLNEDSLSATIVIQPNDDVRGLIKFSQDSRIVIVGEGEASVKLRVQRDQGQQYEVVVAYDTEQMTSSVLVSGATVYPALDNQDFRGQTGTLTFQSGVQDPNEITVSLMPLSVPDNPLPKQFFVRLHTPTNGARVDPQAGTATIRLVKDENLAVWTAVSGNGEAPFSDDNAIVDLVNQLDTQAEGPLSAESLDLIEDVLTKINEEGERRRLPTSVRTSVRNLYCKLLDGSMNDARKGRHTLATAVENFSYTLVTGRPCDSVGSNNKDLERTECAAIRIASGRWRPDLLAGNQFDLQLRNNIKVPSPLPEQGADSGGTADECVDFSLLEYKQQTWFDNGNADDSLMNSIIIAFGLKGRPSASVQNPVTFTVHTQDRRIAAKGAQCKYFDDGSESWVSPSGVCRVTNSLGDDDDFVRCECLHMTHYGVTATTRDDDIIGYVVWFYVICFICMTCILLAVIVHHLFFTRPTFSASLHMHFLMAVFFTHMCFVIDAFLSEDEILPLNPSDDNSDCIAMSLFLHYFFLAQFMWMATQAVNLWKIFVLNDEHTDRHYIVFFIIGWGVPVVLVAIFYAVTYNIYKYHTNLDVELIYGDVNNNREICFITNEYVALGGILAPVLVCLFVLGLMGMKAYNVASQWQMYDDVYRGRSNEKELPWLLLIYGTLVLLCVWLALHMIYGYLWMLVLFCIFDIIFGLLVLVLYAVVRNPLFASIFGPTKASYSVSSDMSAYPDYPANYFSTTPSIKGSEANLLNDAWESNTDGGRSRMTVRRALPSQAYINPPIAVISPAGTISSDSPDFDDLIFALKMGSAGIQSVTPSDISGASGSDSISMHEDDISQLSVVLDHYETKRIDIADTHL